jgi:hypothetical protein
MTNEKYNVWNSFRSGVKDVTKALYHDGKGVPEMPKEDSTTGAYAVGQGVGLITNFVGFALGVPTLKSGYQAIKGSKAKSHQQAVARKSADITRKFN